MEITLFQSRDILDKQLTNNPSFKRIKESKIEKPAPYDKINMLPVRYRYLITSRNKYYYGRSVV